MGGIGGTIEMLGLRQHWRLGARSRVSFHLSPPSVRVSQCSIPFTRLASTQALSTDRKTQESRVTQVDAKPSAKLSEIRRLMALYAPEKKPLALSMSALAVSTAITMCVPFGMGKVVDLVTTAGGAAELTTMTGALAGLFVVGSIANIIRVDVTNMIGERITNRLRLATYQSIIKQELGFFDEIGRAHV